MPVPFGIGVGDFIAVLTLVWEIQEAFRDAVGAVDQYRTILDAIGGYEHTIITCRHLSTQWVSQLTSSRKPDGSVDLPCGDQALINGICYMLRKSQEAMDRFMKENRKYTESFVKARSMQSMNAQWRKVKFVFRRSEVDKLEATVREYAKSLQSYTITLAMRVMMKQSQNSSESVETIQMLKATEAGIGQIQRLLMFLQKDFGALIRIIENDLPNMLGYPWSRAGFSPDEKPILLRDALGRTVHLPFLLCTSNNQFSCLMKVLFDGLPGAVEVSRDDYTLHREKDGSTIKSECWEQNLKAGDSLTMSVIIRQVFQSESTSEKGYETYTCMRCELRDIPTSTFQCPKCLRDSRIIEEERIIPLAAQPAAIPQRKLLGDSCPSSAINRPNKRAKSFHPKPTQKGALQRVTFIKEYIRPSWEIREDVKSYYHYKFDPSPLHIAVLSGNIEELQRIVRVDDDLLQKLLEQRDYYSFRDESVRVGMMPLHYAARMGRNDMVAVLLEAGADIDAAATSVTLKSSLRTQQRVRAFSGNFTALSLSLDRGHADVAKLLLDYGARNCVSEDVESAMEFVIRAGNTEFLEMLIEAGVSVNGDLVFETPPLSIAVSCGNIDAARRLISTGADVNKRDRRGSTLLQLACLRNSVEMTRLLLQSGANALLKGDDLGYGGTALQVAANWGNMGLINVLLDTTTNFNSELFQGPGSNHMFCYAVRSGCVELVELLVECGADIYNTSSVFHMQPPLVLAACNSDLPMVRTLLSCGANPNQLSFIGGYGITPLAAAKIPAVIRELLNAGTEASDAGKKSLNVNLRINKQASEILASLSRPAHIQPYMIGPGRARDLSIQF